MHDEGLPQDPKRRGLWGLALFAGATALAAAAGGAATAKGKDRRLWYRRLSKPRYNPPDWVFAPVWTTLYGLMAVSAYRVWRAPISPDRSRALALWGAQLGLNAAWSPLFFGAHKPAWALVDLGALLATLSAYVASARKVDRPAAALMAPYLAWSGYAGVLNGGIVRRNLA